jgi:hypothetical protein
MPVPALAPAADRSLFRGYRFPPEVIAHAVWLYFRFHLSLRAVQDLLAERGLVVSYETIRQWCDTFGPTFAARLRMRRMRPGRQVVLRRAAAQDQGEAVLAVAGGRSGRDRARYPGAGPARPGRGRGLRATRAGQLRRRDTPCAALQVQSARATLLGTVQRCGNCFRPRRHRLSAGQYRQVREERSLLWREVTLGDARP